MTTTTPNLEKKDKQSGFALFLTLFALFLLTAITLALMFDANVETGINANFRTTQQAFFAAKGGLEEARDRLLNRSLNSSGAADPLPTPGGLPSTSAANVIYMLNPTNGETVDPSAAGSYFDDELCREHFNAFTTDLGSGTANIACPTATPSGTWFTTTSSDSPGTNTATALPYKWVRITLKENDSDGLGNGSTNYVDNTQAAGAQVCWDGTREKVSGCDPANLTTQPVFVLTSMAVTPNKSRALLQAEVAQNPPIFVNAAVDSNSGVWLHGSLMVSGSDECSCLHPQSTDGLSLPGKTCKQQDAVYSGGNITQNGGGTTVGPLVGNSPFNYNVQGLISEFQNAPDAVTCTASACPTGNFGIYPPGSTPDLVNGSGGTPQISIVNGDASFTGGWSGDGVLVVTGNLTFHGGTKFFGLIIVGGTVTMSGGGSAPLNLDGAIISGGSSTSDDIGGSFALQYNACAINQTIAHLPPTYITFRQLDYY